LNEIINAKSGDIENPITPDKEEEEPFYVGGLDLAKVVHSSALDILELKNDVLIEKAWKIWPHVSYATVAKDTHDIYKKYPMYEIGFDHSGVGQAAIELFDNITLPMVPIETTNKFKVDMFNSAQILLETGQLKLAKNSPISSQWSGQQVVINQKTGSIQYPHGSVPNDLVMGLLYAINRAIPFMINSNLPLIITSNTNNISSKNLNQGLDELMGISNQKERRYYSTNRFRYKRQFERIW